MKCSCDRKALAAQVFRGLAKLDSASDHGKHVLALRLRRRRHAERADVALAVEEAEFGSGEGEGEEGRK
jgi:hypothetical protein